MRSGINERIGLVYSVFIGRVSFSFSTVVPDDVSTKVHSNRMVKGRRDRRAPAGGEREASRMSKGEGKQQVLVIGFHSVTTVTKRYCPRTGSFRGMGPLP